MAKNIDPRLVMYRDRLLRIEEDRRDLALEMKNSGLSNVELRGIRLAVRNHFKTEQQLETKRMLEAAAEEVADMLAAQGMPLFAEAAA